MDLLYLFDALGLRWCLCYDTLGKILNFGSTRMIKSLQFDSQITVNLRHW
jgi:hypothetical protein